MAARRRIGVYSLPSGGAVSIVPSLLDRRALMIGFGSVTPKQIDQGVDLLSEIIDDAIDDPTTDVTEFLVRLPEAPTLIPRRRARASAHLDSRFRRRPALPKSSTARASSLRSGSGAARLMAQVVSIYRYPVKGLSAEALSRAQLEAEKPFPHDRVFALARPSAPIDAINPQWAKKGLFAMLMLDEGSGQGHDRTRSQRSPAYRPPQGASRYLAAGWTSRTTAGRWRPSSGRCCRTSPPRLFYCARVAAISWTSRTM